MNTRYQYATTLLFIDILLTASASALAGIKPDIDKGTIYHVNQAIGNDSYAGTVTKPFLTIGKCASLAHPGDTCLIHTGTYRETVKPYFNGQPGHQISFIAAKDENVIVTGLDALSSTWKKISSSVFTTESISHVKQLFVGNKLMKIAQTPNSNNYFNPAYATIKTAECKTVSGGWSRDPKNCKTFDEDGICGKLNNCWNRSFPKQLWRISSDDLAKSSNWKGGIIAIVDKWSYNAERAIILKTKKNELEFEWFNEKPLEPGLRFTITNSPASIDKAGEWSYSKNDHKLYFSPPDLTTIPTNIFARTRDLAFDLRGKKHITVAGFELFAASIETDKNSSYCILNHLTVSYPVYHQMFGAKRSFPGQGTNRYSISPQTMGKGVTLGGHNNTLQNSKISHSWCDGITVYGSRNNVLNNEVSDVDWSMTACAAISTNGDHLKIERNKLHDCGRSCLWHQMTFDTEFSYNDIFNACWLGKDCGVTGSIAWYGKARDLSSDADGDGIGNIIDHNWIHDNKNHYGGACIYLDNDEQNYGVHHNVLWNCKFALIMNDTYIPHGPTGHHIYNNTCFNVEFRSSDFGKDKNWKLQGVVFSNNLCTSSHDAHYNTYNTADIIMEDNIGPGDANIYASPNPPSNWPKESLKLVDPEARDFRPTQQSLAEHTGKPVHNYTAATLPISTAGAYQDDKTTGWRAGNIEKSQY